MLAAAAIACALPCSAADQSKPDWSITRIGLRDYVPLAKIASFYQLEGDPQPEDSFVSLLGEKRSLQAMLDSRQVIINGVKQWLGFPVTLHNGEAMVSRIDLVKTLEPALRPESLDGLGRIDTIVLDAGHGGHDLGAVGFGITEKDLNLAVCRRLRPLLERKGFTVVLTRDSDVFIPLGERARLANGHENAIFVSVHFNYSPNGASATGVEVFALAPRGTPATHDAALRQASFSDYPGSPCDSKSLVLATTIHHAILGNLPRHDRGVKRARFAVLKLTRMPAVLLEGAFLSNGSDTEQARSKEWQEAYATAIASGIVDFRRVAADRTPPRLVADYRGQPKIELARRDAFVPIGAESIDDSHHEGN